MPRRGRRLRSRGAAVSDPRWMDRALCVNPGASEDYWSADEIGHAREARRWCLVCPVKSPCLEAALADEIGEGEKRRFGIRAGLNGPERFRLQKRRDAAREASGAGGAAA